MQVSCPKCNTSYHVGPDVKEAFGGIVRCGECGNEFSVHDQGEPIFLDKIDQIKSEPSIDKNIEGNDQIENNIHQSGNQARVEPQFSEMEVEEIEFSLPESKQIEDSGPDSKNNFDDEPVSIKQDEDIDDVLGNHDRYSTETVDLPLEDDFSEISRHPLNDDETGNDNFSEYVPYHHSNQHGVASTVLRKLLGSIFWAILLIGLTVLLVGQIQDRLYPAYKHHPTVENIRSFVCQKIPCSEAESHIDSFEMVISRMAEITQPERQLHISIFLLNNAEIALLYPNIKITFKRSDGSTVGQHVFTSAQYFIPYDSLVDKPKNNNARAKERIKSSKMEKILIKFNHPADDAVGFEAQVVP